MTIPRPHRVLAISLLLPSLFAFGVCTAGAQQPPSPKVSVTTVVTVLGPHYAAPPPLAKTNLVVTTGTPVKEEIAGWVRAQGPKAPLELAILIDDGADLNAQIADLRKFILAQPKTTSIGVFYAATGTIQTAADFSADHAAVARKVRVPAGESATSASIYQALMGLVEKWNPDDSRHEILLLADGIDRRNYDPGSPDVRATIAKAQRAGVVIHALYTDGTDAPGHNNLRANYGGGNLFMIADGTGGSSFLDQTDPPIDLKPYLERMNIVLRNQYLLTFKTAASDEKDGEMRSLGVSTGEKQDNVEILTQGFVFVPGS